MRAFGFRVIALALSLSGVAQAAGKALVVEPMDGVKIRIDGDLREWPAKMTELGQTLQGNAGGDPKAKAVVGYDEKYLYVVVTVTDNKLASGDHATLHLAFPKGRDSVTYDVDLQPGIPGKSAGQVKLKGGAAAGAKLVEAPTDKGWEIESQIPWSVFPEATRTRVGLRAAVSLADSDGGGVKAVIGTSSENSGRRMPPLMLATEAGLDAALLKPQGLGGPVRELFGNVAGDGMVEKVAQYGNYLTITGPRFRGGKEFYFGEFGTNSPDMVRKLDLHDFDGDGLEEIVVQKRIGSSTEYREVLQVLKIGKDDAPFATFTHEIGIKSADGLLENKVKIAGGTIEISQGDVEGFEPDTYDEPLAGGMESALLPWASIGSRTYKWQGNGFEKGDEKGWQPKMKKGGGASAPGQKKRAASNEPPPPPPPRPPTADELLDRVYALYRKDRGVGAGKPRFDFVTDVAGDTGTERVLIHDRDIVVFGKGFRQGQSYAFITVGVADSKDVLDATARDLTGDGKAEIIVRGVLHAKASKELGGDTVDRHALFVYGIQGDKVVRIFAAETGRAVGKDRIFGAVAFDADKKGLSIELRPAQAVGWTQKTYPFPPDTTTAGGLEPLLLPWGDSAKRRYRFNGSAYVLE